MPNLVSCAYPLWPLLSLPPDRLAAVIARVAWNTVPPAERPLQWVANEGWDALASAPEMAARLGRSEADTRRLRPTSTPGVEGPDMPLTLGGRLANSLELKGFWSPFNRDSVPVTYPNPARWCPGTPALPDYRVVLLMADFRPTAHLGLRRVNWWELSIDQRRWPGFVALQRVLQYQAGALDGEAVLEALALVPLAEGAASDLAAALLIHESARRRWARQQLVAAVAAAVGERIRGRNVTVRWRSPSGSCRVSPPYIEVAVDGLEMLLGPGGNARPGLRIWTLWSPGRELRPASGWNVAASATEAYDDDGGQVAARWERTGIAAGANLWAATLEAIADGVVLVAASGS